ncbi:MAG: hypothetical protein Q8P52_01585 [bacterium]|nr:hypothetical protein [bacterium]
MNTVQKFTLYIIVSLVFIGVAGVYIKNDLSGRSNSGGSKKDSTAFDATDKSDEGIVDIGGIGVAKGDADNITIEPISIPSESSVTAPPLNRKLVIPDNFPESAEKSIRQRIDEVISELKDDPSSYENWLILAVHRKTINDYDGAREIWEYLNTVYPGQSVVLGNLGELYHLYLKNYAKSEENYRKAIEAEPSNIAYYRGLFDLYRYSYKTDTPAAENILKEGLEKNKNNLDLLILLAAHYKSGDRVTLAKEYYEKAFNQAKIEGREDLALQLKEIIDNL